MRTVVRLKSQVTWKEFLESTPANVSKHIEGLAFEAPTSTKDTYWKIDTPQLELHCSKDGGPRRFDPSHKEVVLHNTLTYTFVSYNCRDCAASPRVYALMIEQKRTSDGQRPRTPNVEVMKLGEFPPFNTAISSRVEKLLDKPNLDLYRKGLSAERMGLGIGAAGYMRRVVDSYWKTLVQRLKAAAEQTGVDQDVLQRFDDALNETQFSKAVSLLNDALPAKLRILDGQNPLTLLYTPLSVQLHDLTDEDCLQQAHDIRLVLNEMVETVADVIKDHSALRDAANRLRSQRSE